MLAGLFLDVTELLFPMAKEESSTCPLPVSARPSVSVRGLTRRAFMCLCRILGAQLAEEERGRDKELKANQLSVIQGQSVQSG